MGGGGAGGLAPLSGEALEGAALRAEVVRSGPSGSVAVVLRDPYADGGRALAAALAGRLGWARGAAAGGAQPVPVGKCGFSGAGFFTGADTYRMLFDTRPEYTSIGSSSSAAAGAAGPDARPRSGSESSQEATRLWPLRAVLWPVVRRALQLGGTGAEAAELEQRRAQIERQASQVTRDLPNRRQAIVLKCVRERPSERATERAHGASNEEGIRLSCCHVQCTHTCAVTPYAYGSIGAIGPSLLMGAPCVVASLLTDPMDVGAGGCIPYALAQV